MLDRVVSISTLAPSILQPADVVAMAEKMQKLDLITRTVHQLGTRGGSVKVEQMQAIADCVADLLSAAPNTVFTQSITAVPVDGIDTAGGGSGGAAGSSATAAPATESIEALRAKFDAREVQRRTAEAKAQTERAADATILQHATEAAAVAATAPISTTAVQHQVGAPPTQTLPNQQFAAPAGPTAAAAFAAYSANSYPTDVNVHWQAPAATA